MPALHDFTTWQPLLRLLYVTHTETLTAPGGHVAGQISPGAWSVPLPYRPPQSGRASQVSDNQEQFDAVGRIVEALKGAGVTVSPSSWRLLLLRAVSGCI
ncbi:hypothetical protein AB0L71_10275 [Streptomyces sp. NPDC052052]|uniref:hypothetical protein n=1 Tax=Streptomyces sp. NPDC052052 TaxID=3154756 RepID=UPI0034470066